MEAVCRETSVHGVRNGSCVQGDFCSWSKEWKLCGGRLEVSEHKIYNTIIILYGHNYYFLTEHKSYIILAIGFYDSSSTTSLHAVIIIIIIHSFMISYQL